MMTEDEARGDLERTVLTRLRERGWEVSEATRKGATSSTPETSRTASAGSPPPSAPPAPTGDVVDIGAEPAERGKQAVVTPLKLAMALLMVAFAALELHPRFEKLELDRRCLPLGGVLSA